MRSRRLTPTVAVVAAALVALAACNASQTSTADAPSTTEATTTTKASTTTEPTTTTTIAETTTTAAPVLPVPLPAPAPRANEPRLELATMEIPKIGINKTLFEGVSLNTLDLGPGHWPGTAMPGQFGNMVIGGHRTSKDRPFRNIDQLVPGDEVIFTTLGGRYVYRVVRTEIVTPDSLWIVDQHPGYTATLFACHPVGSTRERIVVFLELAA